MRKSNFFISAIIILLLTCHSIIILYAQTAPVIFGEQRNGPPKVSMKHKVVKKKKIKPIHPEYFQFDNIPSGYVVKKDRFTLKGKFVDKDAQHFEIIVNDNKKYKGTVIDGIFSSIVKLSMDNNGINEIDVRIFNAKSQLLGQIVLKLLRLLSTKQQLAELGKIDFTYPPYGYKLGFWEWSIWVEGNAQIPNIKKAILYVNKTPRKIMIKNGRFREKISTFLSKDILLKISVEDTDEITMSSTYHLIKGYN